MRQTRTLGMATSLLSLALVAAACGSGGSKSTAGTNTAAAGAGSTTTSTTASGSTTPTTAGPQPTSLAEWETLWATERAAIIKRIKDNKWGKSADGKTLTGPGGWTVDLTKCPSNWSDTEGVTDTSIKIGASLALSGTYADAATWALQSAFSSAITTIRGSSRMPAARSARSTTR